MAIEIKAKRKSKIPVWTFAAAGILAFLIVFLGASYFYFWLKIKKISGEIQNKESQNPLLAESIKKEEEKILPLQQKINNFGGLLSQHYQSLKILELLEKLCLAKVWFRDFNFTAEENKTTVSAQTNNFLILEQQISILKQSSFINNLTLTDVSISESGKINFTFNFLVEPEKLLK